MFCQSLEFPVYHELLDSVHQGVDKAFRWASITFCDTYNSQWASPTARCGLDRAARSVTVASRPLEPLYEIVYETDGDFVYRST